MDRILAFLEYIAWSLTLVILAVAVSLVGHYILFKVLGKIARRSRSYVGERLIVHSYNPARMILTIFAILFVLPLLDLTERNHAILSQTLDFLLIGAVAWLIIKLTYVMDDFVLSKFKIDIKDNLRARKLYTQLKVFKQIIIVIVLLVAVATILMTFDQVRQLGTSILASAGIIGIVVGVAAQRSIGSFIAGIQIAITQPIRLDDVVIVENEFGRIEEITLTYVVVRLWDSRRIILPITHFIENPFQNWTRSTSELLGTVLLYVDYTVPVQTVREELHRILKETPLWDGLVWGMQVTDASEQTIELRALVSAPDAATAWNLRCHVREHLIAFLQEKFPHALPRQRMEIHRTKPPAGKDADAGDSKKKIIS